MRSIKLHGMVRAGILCRKACNAERGASPRSSRRMAPCTPMSMEVTRRVVWVCPASLTRSICSSTSLTRTTLRPLISITCWSRRSRSSRNNPSAPLALGQSAGSVEVCTLASMLEMAEKGSTRFPDLVFTIRDAMRVRSSWGASVASRTRPVAAPDGSYTVAPNNSESGSEFIRLENSRVSRQREMNCAKLKRKVKRGSTL